MLRHITLWLFIIAMENGPFIDDFPIKTSIYEGFSMAMLNNQYIIIYLNIPYMEHMTAYVSEIRLLQNRTVDHQSPYSNFWGYTPFSDI
jgi:hypothetical protein